MHKRVGLDIDGVFADYHKGIYKATMAKHGEITKDLVHRTECSILDTYNYKFWYDLEPLKLPKKVNLWLEDSWEHDCTTIYFMTRRPPCLHEVTVDWLNKHFDISPSTNLLSGAVEKGRIAQGLYLDHFVDDDPIHCLQVAKYSPKTSVYLANTVHNQWYDLGDLTRIGGQYDR